MTVATTLILVGRIRRRDGARGRRLVLSDDSEPYMILKALDQSYNNHIGFAIIRAIGEEQ